MSVATPTTIQSPAAQERARQIIAAAATVFERQGYANTSMKDIAQEAGVAQGLIHYYFGTKDDLVISVLRTHCSQMIADTVSSFEAAEGSPFAKAWASLDAARRRTSEQPETFRLFFRAPAPELCQPRPLEPAP